jgi:hypothetical protein
MRSVSTSILAVGALFAAAIATPAAVQAAPQILGVVASNGQPTPLNCDSGDCVGHFSSFCLQQVRPGPNLGVAYRLAAGGEVTLIATTAEGQTLRLPAQEHVQFASRIGFTSVKVTLPKAVRAALGIVEASVEVGPLVSLIPVEAADDPSPQTEAEIALATGALRKVAAAAFEAPGTLTDAARLTSAVINRLPPRGEVDAAALWGEAVTPQMAAAATPEGLEMAQRLYEGCQIALESRTALSMRSCLELRHADMMAHRNHQFWDSLGGS